jgi:DNA-binding CsgD family transcriptional regulator
MDGSVISAGCGIALGIALCEDGDHDGAIAAILESVGGPELPRMFPMLRPWAYEAMTRAEVAAGRPDRAAGWAERAAGAVAGVACGLPGAFADRSAALVLDARGDAAAAASRALAAAARADEVGARVEAARSRQLAGRVLAAAGERERAGVQLRAAEAELGICGAARLREECVRELRRIGLRVARAGRRGDVGAPGPASLSGREREVAELVRGRRTNREIAEHLFLSEKTIESHLRSVFVKLGVSSRAEVARVLDAD